jgi:diadenosine tetraphosphatase ApaH/serine/threonine PP2A family protein phosphatase
MRSLILSDVHANIEALEAVLEAAPPADFDRLIVLGDLVGYGADPNAVVERIRALHPAAIIRGNHDKVACGLEDASNFNHHARRAAEWTYETLAPEQREYLRQLPAGPTLVDETIEICHGAPFDEDAYIFDAGDAIRALDEARRPLCIFGHTHIPVVFTQSGEMFDLLMPGPDDSIVLQPGWRYLVNPGSVGQPRDGDPRAAFAIYDSERQELIMRRVAYPLETAQAKILAAGLPQNLSTRLAMGR